MISPGCQRKFICPSLGGVLFILWGTSGWAQDALEAPPVPMPDMAPLAHKTEPAWHITPSAVIEEIATDNVRLAPSHRQGDLISTFGPGLAVSARTRKLQLLLDGQVKYDKYARADDLDGFTYSIAGNANAEILDRLFFVDLRSSIDQQVLNRNGLNSAALRTLPNDQGQVINNSVSPYLQHTFDTWGAGEIRYRLSTLNFANANTGRRAGGTPNFQPPNDTRTNEFLANLHSGPDFARLKWALDANASDSEQGDDRNVDQRSATASLEYGLVREVGLIARAGYDTFKDSVTPEQALSAPSWRLGLHLTPGPRSSLRIEGGRRYGGPYWSGELDYKLSGEFLITATHDIVVTTQTQQLNSALNGLVRNDVGQLVNPITGLSTAPNAQQFSYINQSYLLHTSHLQLAGTRGRTKINIDLSYQTREIGAVSLAQSPAEKQSVEGIEVILGRDLSPRSGLQLQLSVSRGFDTLPNNGNTIGVGTVAYDYKLSPTLTTTLSYRRYSLFNELNTGYRENMITLALRKVF